MNRNQPTHPPTRSLKQVRRFRSPSLWSIFRHPLEAVQHWMAGLQQKKTTCLVRRDKHTRWIRYDQCPSLPLDHVVYKKQSPLEPTNDLKPNVHLSKPDVHHSKTFICNIETNILLVPTYHTNQWKASPPNKKHRFWLEVLHYTDWKKQTTRATQGAGGPMQQKVMKVCAAFGCLGGKSGGRGRFCKLNRVVLSNVLKPCCSYSGLIGVLVALN